MNTTYYNAMDTMEKAGVDRQYMDGWACGFLRNPRRGEQHVTEAYEAGYDDGYNEVMDGYRNWVGKKAA
jgi:hypothetical protein